MEDLIFVKNSYRRYSMQDFIEKGDFMSKILFSGVCGFASFGVESSLSANVHMKVLIFLRYLFKSSLLITTIRARSLVREDKQMLRIVAARMRRLRVNAQEAYQAVTEEAYV